MFFPLVVLLAFAWSSFHKVGAVSDNTVAEEILNLKSITSQYKAQIETIASFHTSLKTNSLSSNTTNVESYKKNLKNDYYDSFYITEAVDENDKSCNGPTETTVGAKLNRCEVVQGAGSILTCNIDVDRVHLNIFAYTDSLSCQSDRNPQLLPFTHYPCASGSTMPNTLARDSCTNKTVEEIYQKIPGFTIL